MADGQQRENAGAAGAGDALELLSVEEKPAT
jgi:hypothetical protein